jgi:tRNA-2-methylthio-N6-dimethylallyladenosine synthase
MDFPSLLRAVCDIEGDFIVRFMTSHPKDVSDELIRVIAESQGKIAPAFHLPLQSGSDRILKLMNRTYDSERFFSILQKLRESIPGIAVTSDIIVGFPTETEDDFEKTLDAVRRAQFDAAYCFVYSKRAGTVAAKMQDQVPDEIKSERIQKLISLQNDVSVRKNEELIGTVQKALVDSVSKKDAGVYTARTDTNKTVHFVSDENLVGKRVLIEIEKVCAATLYGKLFKKI